MIQSHDRSKWFGASETSMIMGNWRTQTFALWWLEKMGLRQNNINTRAMAAGSAYEGRILDYLGIPIRDKQIRIKRLKLRVNLDGETQDEISEVKTHAKPFKVIKPYWQQVQVEMYAAKKPARIVAYETTKAEYQNFFLPIEPERLSFHPIEYDPKWIEQEYLPRLKYTAWCLKKRRFPQLEEFERYIE